MLLFPQKWWSCFWRLFHTVFSKDVILMAYYIVPVPFFCPRFLVRIVLAEDSKLENRGQNGTRVICVYVNMSLPEMTSLQICKLCNCVFCHKSNTSLTHSEHYIKHVWLNMNSIWTQFDILWPQSDLMRPIFDPSRALISLTYAEHYLNQVGASMTQDWPNMNSIWTQFDNLWPQSDPSYDVTC